jgi:conserved protein found in conjugate transposon traK
MKNLGEDFYTALRKNNRAVITIAIIAGLSIISAFAFAFMVYQNSTENIYAINEKSELVPLKKRDLKEANLIQAKANIEYFVQLYYTLDAYSMKQKRERVLWLVGEQPKAIIRDRAKKGYFDEFLSIAGLTQNAEILQHTLKINDEAPYQASFVVRIQRINGGIVENYNNNITLTMDRVNRNYPYNPYGLLITQFSENLTRAEIKKNEDDLELKQSEEAINQNPKEDGKGE